MNKKLIIIVLVLVTIGLIALVLARGGSQTTQPAATGTPTSEGLVGADRDEHGCILSAGYSWCEARQECLRPWETPCLADNQVDEAETIKSEIKTALVAKHGPNAQSLTVSVSKIEGNYAQGGASEEGMGGGMWFAARVNGKWKLVWDGNGIITCDDLAEYPDFPNSLIPQCFDQASSDMLDR